MASSTSWRARAAEAAASEEGFVVEVEVDVGGGGEVELPPSLAVDAIGKVGDRRGDIASRLRGAVALAFGDVAAAAFELKPHDIIARRDIAVEKRRSVRARVYESARCSMPEEFLSKVEFFLQPRLHFDFFLPSRKSLFQKTRMRPRLRQKSSYNSSRD